MNRIFNTKEESSIRILLLLQSLDDEFSTDRIAAYDFLALYGKYFQLSNYNLHGNNVFFLSEFTVKRKLCYESIKDLVKQNLVNIIETNDGFHYSINDRGSEIASSIHTDYSMQYIEILNTINRTMRIKDDNQLIEYITKFHRRK